MGVPGPVRVSNSFCSAFIAGGASEAVPAYRTAFLYMTSTLALPYNWSQIHSTPMNDTSPLIGLCAADEVPEGGALKVERDNLVLAVFNLGGRFYVTDDACTHGPGSLSEGEIDGDIV